MLPLPQLQYVLQHTGKVAVSQLSVKPTLVAVTTLYQPFPCCRCPAKSTFYRPGGGGKAGQQHEGKDSLRRCCQQTRMQALLKVTPQHGSISSCLSRVFGRPCHPAGCTSPWQLGSTSTPSEAEQTCALVHHSKHPCWTSDLLYCTAHATGWRAWALTACTSISLRQLWSSWALTAARASISSRGIVWATSDSRLQAQGVGW